jgi:outer membrane receptor protein involved in Fe transport
MRARCHPHLSLGVAVVFALGLANPAWARLDEVEGPALRARFDDTRTFGEHDAFGNVQWHREDESWRWFARVSLGDAAPARTLNGEARWLFSGWPGHALAVGALGQQRLPAPGEASVAGTTADQRLGAYVNDEWQLLPSWRLVLGARADRAADGEQALAPRAALLWQAWPGLEVKLLDGVAYREPSASLSPLRELAPQIDPTLGSERLRASELALDWQALDNLRLAASLYRNDAGKSSDTVVMGSTQGLLQFRNLGRAHGNGIELGGDYAADAGWQLRASWAAALAGNDDAAANEAPRNVARLQALAPLPWRGAHASVEWWRMGERVGAPGGGAPDALSLLNATMVWSPRGTPWNFSASAYNLSNRTLAASDSVDPLHGLLMGDGRRLQLRLDRAF